MAKVEWADAIKTVSGALTKINKKSQHAGDQKMILATHRVAETTSPNCTSLFIREANVYDRTTPLSTKEMQAQSRFAAVSAAVKARAKSLEYAASDRQAFLEQKDEANGRKTMKSYLWKVCGDIYDQQHQG